MYKVRNSLKYTIMQVEKAVPKRWIDSGGSPACNSKRKDNNPEKNFWRTLRSG